MEYWIKIGLVTAMMVLISEATETKNTTLQCRKTERNGTVCSGNKLCPINMTCDDSLECPCMEGYRSSNSIAGIRTFITCDDILECTTNVHVCGSHTQCRNTEGGYYCECNEGFRRENITKFCPTNNRAENFCSDINECIENPNICNSNSNCTNIPGSYKCVCKEGFKNISNQCTVIKTCKNNIGICGMKGVCTAKNDSLSCSCQDGYKGVPLGVEYLQCNVVCKQNNMAPPQCDDNELLCHLEKFSDLWKPLCNDSGSSDKLNLDKFLDDLDELISKFSKMENKTQRLQMAGKLLNTLEEITKNLAYLLPRNSTLSNKKNFINAKIIMATSQDREISLRNVNSSIRLDPKMALNAYTPVVGCLEYGNISELLKDAELQKGNETQAVELVSPVVSVFLGIANTANQPIQLKININKKAPKNEMHCAFWSVDNASWSTEGCVTLERNRHGVVCNCTHLTSFAVLMSLKNIESWTLDLITQIGLSISIVCLVLAILTFCLCRFLRGTRNTIHIHLCVTLLLGHCIFLIGIEATSSRVICGIVAGSLHFFYLSAFCWMSLEGLELYLMLVTVFKTQVKTAYLLAVGYGVPTVIIIISALARPSGYGTKKYCWLSIDGSFIWSFMGPVCAIILVNCGIFVLTVWKLAEKITALSPEQGKLKRIRTLTVTSIAQLCILGCCWAFGFLMFGQASLFFAYAFTICNVLQGVQIFFLHCIMNKKVRERYSEVICAIVHFRAPLYSEFSNSTNANTQMRTKLSKESGL